MSNLISRSALLEEFKKCHISFNGTPMEKSDMMISYRSLARVINKQQTVEAMPVEWIPCSEMLPERDRPFQTGGYLVTAQFVKDGKTGKEFTSQASFDYENKRWLVRDCEVLAWCELPEPYNADMRGGKND